MSDFTFVIQGMLHPNALAALPLYLMHGDVIISCWSDSPGILREGQVTSSSRLIGEYVKGFQDFYDPSKRHEAKAVMRKSKTPRELNDQKIYNYNNCYYQYQTTLTGLSFVKTKFAVKLRCDEFYTHLPPLLDTVRKNEGKSKITTTNTWFRKTRAHPYHPGDHVVAGETSDMIKLFEKANNFCENGGYFEPQDASRMVGKDPNFKQFGFDKVNEGEKRWDEIKRAYPTPVAEQIICLSHILATSNEDIGDNRKQLMKKYIDVVPVDDLGFVSISRSVTSNNRRTLTSDTYYCYPQERLWSLKNSMDEIE